MITTSGTQGPVTATEMPCLVPDLLAAGFGSGPYEVSISDDGAIYSTTSATILVECEGNTYGDFCATCACFFPSLCDDGWQGDGFCNGCPAGLWGPDCGSVCLACSVQACEQDTGACICNPGFYSPDCSMECPGGAATACSGNGTCDDGAAGSGVCTCADGFWGEACESTCPVNCAGTPPVCDQATGECLACAPGFSGAQCEVTAVPALSAPLRGLLAVLLLVASGLYLRRSRAAATSA